MEKTVTLKLDDDLTIELTGIYVPEEKEVTHYPDGDGYPGMSAYFDIIDVKIVKGDALDLIHYVNGVSDIWYELETLAIKEIEND